MISGGTIGNVLSVPSQISEMRRLCAHHHFRQRLGASACIHVGPGGESKTTNTHGIHGIPMITNGIFMRYEWDGQPTMIVNENVHFSEMIFKCQVGLSVLLKCDMFVYQRIRRQTPQYPNY